MRLMFGDIDMRRNLCLVLVLVAGVIVVSGCGKKKIDAGDTEVIPGGIELDGNMHEGSMGAISFTDDPNRERVEGVDFSPVQFGYDSDQIAPREMEKVESVAEYLNDNSDTVLVIEGHCDERGSRDYNLSLGDRRALSVRTYLNNLGIDYSRVQTKSFGEESPLDPGHNEAAWRLNRRGEFVFYRSR